MIRHALALALCALAAAGLGAASAAPKADDPKRTLQQEPLEAPRPPIRVRRRNCFRRRIGCGRTCGHG
jgi:hypothetical protein